MKKSLAHLPKLKQDKLPACAGPDSARGESESLSKLSILPGITNSYTIELKLISDTIGEYKWAAFNLHQACEHAYKAVLLIFIEECPQEHLLSYLGLMATNRCDPAFGDIFPMKTQKQKDLFELLDYAYIGARYDPKYKITKEELEQLAPCVKILHEMTERICKEKIESFV